MISTKKSYVVYVLNAYKKRVPETLEAQLQDVFYSYTKRFGCKPETHYLGPVVDQYGQVLVKDGEIWIEVPQRTQMATTAYPQKE